MAKPLSARISISTSRPHCLSDGLHDSLQNGHDVRGSPLVARSQHGTHQVARVGIEDQQRMQNVVSVIPVVEGELLLAVSVVVGTVQIQG